ncbi:sulfite oxidase heme-binding subunit YedZ [Acidipila sp. EB88]|uniref:sulfite oxidase heme-binding subunit YedZ n=1 Tax=Acidipila sp. EB88 TaxID=2305226 RepID=UPI001F1FB44D|nr:protein-methionine-sulfoxide reductase heme-binding subunit MsrQ [Acidipila sp. EB88]
MSNRWIVVLKVLVHAACLLPLAYLVWLFYRSATVDPSALGPDPTSKVSLFTGFGALRLIVISLVISPVRKLLPRLGWLIRFRRMLGLYAFAWATLHVLAYLWLYVGWSWPALLDDLSRRRYIWAGLTAWGLMVPLALTSTTWSIRALGGKRWNLLHRLVYVSAIAAVVHYWWIVKAGVLSPLTVTVTLGVLLLLRPFLAWWKARRSARPATSAVA